MRYSFVASPLGDLLVAGDDQGLAALYLPTGRHQQQRPDGWDRDDDAFTPVRAQLAEYFAGERRDFDLALNARATPFQQRVWTALCKIPYGATVSYGRLADDLGSPGAARAVGLANARNPISIIVPCHRIVGATGALTGYGGGLPAKSWLLRHEQSRSSAQLQLL